MNEIRSLGLSGLWVCWGSGSLGLAVYGFGRLGCFLFRLVAEGCGEGFRMNWWAAGPHLMLGFELRCCRVKKVGSALLHHRHGRCLDDAGLKLVGLMRALLLRCTCDLHGV